MGTKTLKITSDGLTSRNIPVQTGGGAIGQNMMILYLKAEDQATKDLFASTAGNLTIGTFNGSGTSVGKQIGSDTPLGGPVYIPNPLDAASGTGPDSYQISSNTAAGSVDTISNMLWGSGTSAKIPTTSGTLPDDYDKLIYVADLHPDTRFIQYQANGATSGTTTIGHFGTSPSDEISLVDPLLIPVFVPLYDTKSSSGLGYVNPLINNGGIYIGGNLLVGDKLAVIGVETMTTTVKCNADGTKTTSVTYGIIPNSAMTPCP